MDIEIGCEFVRLLVITVSIVLFGVADSVVEQGRSRCLELRGLRRLAQGRCQVIVLIDSCLVYRWATAVFNPQPRCYHPPSLCFNIPL